jgi:hypothetical protein
MQTDPRLYRRGKIFDCRHNATGKEESLGTKEKAQARERLATKSEASRDPSFNFRKAQTYLSACDPSLAYRTWHGRSSHNETWQHETSLAERHARSTF